MASCKWLLSDSGHTFLTKEYSQNERSTASIAAEIGTYSNYVNRALKHHGIHVRTASEAQKASLSTGSRKHPTEGTKRSETTKTKIAASVAKAWKALSDEEMKLRVERSREYWMGIDPEEKERIKTLATEGIRRAASEGSDLEKYLVKSLLGLGYKVEWHAECLIHNEKMHVDILIPQAKIAIEVDGPSHHLPIWGEENLEKAIFADQRKNGLLLGEGYTVIRLKCLLKTVSAYRKRVILKNLLECIGDENAKGKLMEVSVD